MTDRTNASWHTVGSQEICRSCPDEIILEAFSNTSISRSTVGANSEAREDAERRGKYKKREGTTKLVELSIG
eukprot:5303431-Heterocapsa_arctica.AAC.1